MLILYKGLAKDLKAKLEVLNKCGHMKVSELIRLQERKERESW